MMRAAPAIPSVAVPIGALLFAFACSASRDANENYRACKSDGKNTGCEQGEVCYRGYCLKEGSNTPDAGNSDGAVDADVPDADSGSGTDAGPAPEPCPEDMEGEERFCYDGDGDPIGECQTGKSKCMGGVWGPCLGQILPAAQELCNNDDDDCDGETDEDLELATCDTAMEGECGVGMLVCSMGSAICRQTVVPQPESCDAKDNDCDGNIDEGEVGKAACYSGETGCTGVDGVYECTGTCRAGVKTCVNGETQPCLGEVTPVEESCDKVQGPNNMMIAADEDCDGTTDEGCDCLSLGTLQDCYGGPSGTLGVGECMAGKQECVASGSGGMTWSSCLLAVLPTAESCANPGEDNDCNDEVDDIPLEGTPCAVEGAVGRCHNGTRRCVDDELICVGLEPRAMETCDSTDDDCDGEVDEGFNLQDDELNCGRCGNACAGNETCCAGKCVDTNTDEDYCGSCDSDCGSGLTCCGGSCVDTNTHLSNCGGCGKPCMGLGQCCRDGMCKSLLCL